MGSENITIIDSAVSSAIAQDIMPVLASVRDGITLPFLSLRLRAPLPDLRPALEGLIFNDYVRQDARGRYLLVEDGSAQAYLRMIADVAAKKRLKSRIERRISREVGNKAENAKLDAAVAAFMKSQFAPVAFAEIVAAIRPDAKAAMKYSLARLLRRSMIKQASRDSRKWISADA